ncbi:MAG: aminotransferase class V-fold PLP-dependent enzyme [Candidatus Kariarchaeaceae archaeon]
MYRDVLEFVNNPSSREQMYLKDNLVYLNHASIGPLPKRSLDIIQSIYSGQSRLGVASITLEERLENRAIIRENISRLLHGSVDGVSITTGTASGLHIVADGLHDRFGAGKNIVITEAEFNTNSYTWQQVVHRHNMELRVVPLSDGKLLFEDWERLVDDNTVLTALSHVQFSNGYKSNLQQISRLTHDHNGFVVVDAIQSLGVIPFDVRRNEVDFVAAGGFKWLLGPFNIGLFYCKPELVEELSSILVGWYSSEDYLEMIHQPYQPWSDARRFQLSPIANIPAFNASIETVLSWGIDANYEHIISLLDYFISQIADTNYSVSLDLEENERSGILRVDTSHDALKVVQYLLENDIVVAFRQGAVRITPHRYNSKDDIDRLVDALIAFKPE